MSCLEQMSFSVSDQMMSSLEKMFVSFGEGLIRKVSAKYSFDYDECLRYVGLSDIKLTRHQVSIKGEKSEKSCKQSECMRIVPSFILPFCGKINENWCNGLRANRELYTQCTGVRVKGGSYCKTCQKQSESSSSGKPKCGTIQDRMEQGDDFEVSGKKPVNYGNVMEKEKISREAAEAEALKFGWTIPEDQFEKVAKAGRGRPKTTKCENKKSLKVSDEGQVEKKGRGRPKKDKKLVSNNKCGDDVIAALVAKAKASNAVAVPESEECEAVAEVPVVPVPVVPVAVPVSVIGVKSADKKTTKVVKKVTDKESKSKAEAEAKSKAKAEVESKSKVEAATKELSEEDVDSDSDVEVEVKKWVHKGKAYLKSTHNKVYDIKTQAVIGIWDPNTDTIEEVDDSASDDESDE